MLEPQLLSSSQMNRSYIFLVLGVTILAFGLYMGFMKNSNSVIVLAFFGSSVVLFGLALSPIMKLYMYQIFNLTKIESQPEVKTESQPEVKIESQPEVKIESQPEVKIESQPEVKIESQPEVKIESQPEVKIDVVTLMNTKLGEVILTSLLKDPENIGHIVAKAIIQAGVTMERPQITDVAIK